MRPVVLAVVALVAVLLLTVGPVAVAPLAAVLLLLCVGAAALATGDDGSGPLGS
ncbi:MULTISPECIES: hypothetical protein [unclassified Curtobacterium]|uniref:hypothetical protein n=1 Tax=unclassified Curtobacterium TaxID=257496 RepID=UPI002859AC16|nr:MULTISPECIES: hypothetical protein [unclassified Curtobacterium]MDR6170111.1 hypothetical protein [Curtobacterium sp. SORGH_AS_0776]MDR6574209.1 hypothetical protein [Curtobacterium sp. 320]